MSKIKTLICMCVIVSLVSTCSINAEFNRTSNVTVQLEPYLLGFKCLSVVGPNFDPFSELLFTAKFESYEGTTNRTGPFNPIIGRFGAENNVDLLCDEVNVSEYDVIWLPGEYHDFNNSLSYYPTAISLILDAYNEGLVIAALNLGQQLLAYMDIIDGKNISAPNPLYDIIEAAGANFFGEDDGIITDLPFVTCTGWDEPNLIFAVAAALGVDIPPPTYSTWDPPDSAAISIPSLIFIMCVSLLAFIYKKKRR
jgi:putative intracellular protease/amidase